MLYLCSKYLETFTQIKEREKSFAKLSIDLLAGMRDMIRNNQVVGIVNICIYYCVDM